jgi:hypothetical protein
VTFQERVHLDYGGCGCGAFGFPDVLLAEQELTVEVGYLDMIGVGQDYQALFAAACDCLCGS